MALSDLWGPKKPGWAQNTQHTGKTAAALLAQIDAHLARYGATYRVQGNDLLVTTRDGKTTPVHLSFLAMGCAPDKPDKWAAIIDYNLRKVLPSDVEAKWAAETGAKWEAENREELARYDDWEYARERITICLMKSEKGSYPPPGVVYPVMATVPGLAAVAGYEMSPLQPCFPGLLSRHLEAWGVPEDDVFPQAVANANRLEAPGGAWTPVDLLPDVEAYQTNPAREPAVASAVLYVDSWADDAPMGVLLAVPRTDVLLCYRPQPGEDVRRCVERLLDRAKAARNDWQGKPGYVLTSDLYFRYDGETEVMPVVERTVVAVGASPYDFAASPNFRRVHLGGRPWDDRP